MKNKMGETNTHGDMTLSEALSGSAEHLKLCARYMGCIAAGDVDEIGRMVAKDQDAVITTYQDILEAAARISRLRGKYGPV